MKFKNMVVVAIFVALLFFSIPVFTHSNAMAAGTGIIQCGQGKSMCTLCDLIKGMNIVIHYLMRIAIGVALLAVTIGGVLYVVSAGDKGLIDQAKSTMKNAAYGFVIIFAGWLIINTTISYLGTNSTMGMKSTTTWGQFECTPSQAK